MIEASQCRQVVVVVSICIIITQRFANEKPDLGPQYLNVSVERTGYEPVPIEWALEQLREKQRVATVGDHNE